MRYTRFDTGLSARYARFDTGLSAGCAHFDMELHVRCARFGARLFSALEFLMIFHFLVLQYTTNAPK